ncbi:MAG: hypothetical protein H6621_02670 [Halobacteriovoraceae bacterium]|nr:hypothetical protein [Halobacteriovoraceae bacterium]
MKLLLWISLVLFPLFWGYSKEIKVYEIERLSSKKIQIQFKIDTSLFERINGNRNGAFLSGVNYVDLPGTPAIPYSSFLIEAHPRDLKIDLEKSRKQLVLNPRVSRLKRSVYQCRCSSRYKRMKTLTSVDYKILEQYRASFAVQYLGDFRGKPLTQVVVYPINYDIQKKKAEIYPDLKMTIVSRAEEKLEIFDTEVELGETVPEKFDLKSRNNNLLILSPRRFVKSLEPFVTWKKTLGFQVLVFTLEDLGRRPEVIKENLKRIYARTDMKSKDRGAFSYAIIVGDEDVFPTFYTKTTFDDKTPTDLPYFTFGGAGDAIPDVFYGRFVARNEKQVQNQIQKIIDYEKANQKDFNGFKNSLMIASEEGESPSDEEILQKIQLNYKQYYKSRVDFLKESQGTAVAERINDFFERGSFWVTYLGHGSGESWSSTNDNYDIHNISQIQAHAIKPVVLDLACSNGRYLPGSMGERFMNAEDVNYRSTGATAYIGGSVEITWEPPAIMATGMNLIKESQHLVHLGQILMGGQFYLAQNWDYANEVIENMAWFHIFGDPTLLVRMKPPKKIKMNKLGSSVSFSSDEGSLKDTIVVFHNKKDKFVVRKTNGAGAVPIPREPGIQYVSILTSEHQYLEEPL